MEITRDEIIQCLQKKDIRQFSTPNREPLTPMQKYQHIHYCLFGAFYPNYFIREPQSIDMRDVERTLNGRDPMRTVYFSGFPQNQEDFGDLYERDIKKFFEVTNSSVLLNRPEQRDISSIYLAAHLRP